MKAAERLRIKCARLADQCLIGISPSVISDFGLEYRKGKTWEDVVHAVKKARKAGMAKTEFELSWMELYFTGVLKLQKNNKP